MIIISEREGWKSREIDSYQLIPVHHTARTSPQLRKPSISPLQPPGWKQVRHTFSIRDVSCTDFSQSKPFPFQMEPLGEKEEKEKLTSRDEGRDSTTSSPWRPHRDALDYSFGGAREGKPAQCVEVTHSHD